MNAPEQTPDNAESFKRTMRAEWDAAAAGWDEWSPSIGEWLREATATMIADAGIAPEMRVLDIAAGAGQQTLDIAQKVGPTGSVVATDLSPGILAFVSENAAHAGYDNISAELADGECLPFADATFDAAVSRLGLMFFADPLQGLREMKRTVRPGGRVAIVVFAGPQTNPCIVTLVSTALRHAGLPPRDPWQPGGLLSLGKPGLIDTLFGKAGFTDVATRRISAPFCLPSVDDYVRFVRMSAGPIIELLNRLDEDGRAAAWAEIRESLLIHGTDAGWAGPNELLLTSGRA